MTDVKEQAAQCESAANCRSWGDSHPRRERKGDASRRVVWQDSSVAQDTEPAAGRTEGMCARPCGATGLQSMDRRRAIVSLIAAIVTSAGCGPKRVSAPPPPNPVEPYCADLAQNVEVYRISPSAIEQQTDLSMPSRAARDVLFLGVHVDEEFPVKKVRLAVRWVRQGPISYRGLVDPHQRYERFRQAWRLSTALLFGERAEQSAASGTSGADAKGLFDMFALVLTAGVYRPSSGSQNDYEAQARARKLAELRQTPTGEQAHDRLMELLVSRHGLHVFLPHTLASHRASNESRVGLDVELWKNHVSANCRVEVTTPGPLPPLPDDEVVGLIEAATARERGVVEPSHKESPPQ